MNEIFVITDDNDTLDEISQPDTPVLISYPALRSVKVKKMW